jgi:hypothetical protein
MGMTERDRKVLAIVIAVVVLGGFWFLVVGKKRSAIKEAQTAQIAAQADLDQSKAAEAAALTVAKIKPAAYSRLLRLGKAIPEDKDFESLLVQVSDITDDANVDFSSLTISNSAATPGSGATGTTTCDVTAATPAAAAAAPAPASGATGAPTGATGSSAAASSSTTSDSSTKVSCADSATLTDIAAKAAGLKASTYNLNFTGSFYHLNDVFTGIEDMVTVNKGRVGVTGRLLDVNSISMTVTNFPQLAATVVMTGYELPVAAAAAQATASGAVTPSAPAAAAAAASPAPADGQDG